MKATSDHLLQPQRSAHASIRGYLYQSCLAALRWLRLGRNEIIVFEGNEDIDRFILHRNLSIYEQTKDLAGPVDIRHESVRQTLNNFLISYVALRPHDENSRFIFTTTAQFRRRLSVTGINILADWHNKEKRPEVVKELRSLLLCNHLKKTANQRRRPKRLNLPDLPAAIEWLDAASGRWDGFFDAVEWHSGAPDHSKILRQIADDLSSRPHTRDLANDLTFRLVMEVFLASSQPEPAKRSKNHESLNDFIREVRKELSGWRASPMAANLRAVFDEASELGRVLKDLRLDPKLDTMQSRPGKVLPAYYETVPFDVDSRQDVLKKLAIWCEGTTNRSVWLIYGDGGSGKTRLMLEWCQRLEHHGWHSGFLDTDTAYTSPPALQPLLEGVAHRLIVIDYAEQHPEAAQRLIKQLSQSEAGPKIRLVLLTRHIPDWWRKLRLQSEALDDLLHEGISPEPLFLSPLFPQETARANALSKAIQIFADTLGRELPTNFEVDLTLTKFDNALFLYAEALSIVYGDPLERRHDILETILAHEQRFWKKEIDALNLKARRRKELDEAISPVIAAITLLGEVSLEREARDLIKAITGRKLRRKVVHDLIWILERICGNDNGSCTSLQPDLLGEQLIESILREQGQGDKPMLLTRVFEATSDTKALLSLTKTSMRLLLRRGAPAEPAIGRGRLEHGLQWLKVERRELPEPWSALPGHAIYAPALTILTRLVQRQPEQRWRLNKALSGRLEHLADIALDVAVETGNPIGSVLAEVIEQERSIDLLESILTRFDEPNYRDSGALFNAVLASTQRILEHRRELTAAREEQAAEIARLNNNQGFSLGRLGRQEEAREAARVAVKTFRDLPSGGHERDYKLTVSLSNLGVIESNLGNYEDATQATEEAVRISRELTGNRLLEAKPVLAQSLINLGSIYFSSGLAEKALEVTQEAVKLLQQLTDEDPRAFRAHLARSLNNLGTILRSLGRFDEALEVTSRSLNLRKSLAADRPDIFLADLAASLQNIANTLRRQAGRRDEALASIREAVEIRRRIAAQRPEVVLPDLADSLETLAAALMEVPEHEEEALAVIREAVEIRRDFAAQRPLPNLSSLSQSLETLADSLLEAGERENALAVLMESLEILLRAETQRTTELPSRLRALLERLTVALEDLDSTEDPTMRISSLEYVVRSVTPFFRKQPLIFADPMNTALLMYMSTLLRTCQVPNREVLMPIIHIIEREILEGSSAAMLGPRSGG